MRILDENIESSLSFLRSSMGAFSVITGVLLSFSFAEILPWRILEILVFSLGILLLGRSIIIFDDLFTKTNDYLKSKEKEISTMQEKIKWIEKQFSSIDDPFRKRK